MDKHRIRTHLDLCVYQMTWLCGAFCGQLWWDISLEVTFPYSFSFGLWEFAFEMWVYEIWVKYGPDAQTT